jgi:hypothetical protein
MTYARWLKDSSTLREDSDFTVSKNYEGIKNTLEAWLKASRYCT